MIIYKCRICGDEMFSDAFKLLECPESPALVKIQGKMITKSSGIDDRLIGGNASAEDPSQSGADDTAIRVSDVVDACELKEAFFDKKSFSIYLKDYSKKVLAKIECEEAKQKFKDEAPSAVKYLLKQFKNITFYSGPAMDPDGSHAFELYEEESINPYYLFFRDAFVAEKC